MSSSKNSAGTSSGKRSRKRSHVAVTDDGIRTKKAKASDYRNYQVELLELTGKAYKLNKGQEIECPMEEGTFFRFEGVINPYNLLRFQSPDEASLLKSELERLGLYCKSFPDVRKLSEVCIAIEKRGTSLGVYLKKSEAGLFFGPTLLKYRGILIDLIEAHRYLMDTRIKCVLSLDTVFIDVEGGVFVSFTEFEVRDPGTKGTNSDWSDFADFVVAMNKVCGYDSNDPSMNDFLKCLRPRINKEENTVEWDLDNISSLPLFWVQEARTRFFWSVAEAWIGTRRAEFDSSDLSIPENWKETTDKDLKLRLLMDKLIPCKTPKLMISYEYVKAFRDKMGHMGRKRNPHKNYPTSREDVLKRMEKALPSLMPDLKKFATKNVRLMGDFEFPKAEERLKNLSV